MLRHLIFCFSIFFCIYSSEGQNKKTKDGLKVGKWIKEYELENGKFKETGLYKIVPINYYEVIGSFNNLYLKINYKNNSHDVYFSGQHNDSLSIKDGIWETKNSKDKTYKIENYSQGILQWTKYYDEHGILSEYNYRDFENDTSFYLTYKNNQLFKKAFYPPEDKNHQTKIYYPNNNLIIPNAELDFNARFGDDELNTIQLNLKCKKDITIKSIRSCSKNIEIGIDQNKLPYNLLASDSLNINLIYNPTPFSFKENDTIKIITSEENVILYNIYCTLKASHIDNRNVETIREIKLSKSKDKYLFISQMGTITNAIISSNNGFEKIYKIKKNTKIDISKLSIGEYQLQVNSCNDIGGALLLVTE